MLFIVGGGAVGFFIFYAFVEAVELWLAYIGSAACGLAAWCYLIAQLVYIRAALEK